MPIVHDPKTGKFSSAGGASSARSKLKLTKGAKVRTNVLGSETMEVFEKRGNMVYAAPVRGPNAYGSGDWFHKTKLVKA